MNQATEVVSRKQIWSWALYDWANSTFATTVIAGFFPLFFKQYWSAGADAVQSTFKLGMANSVASIVVAVSAPLLGALADRTRNKKRFLAGFAALGILMTAALYAVAKGDYLSAAALYVLATVGFSGSVLFYDSLLVSVAKPEESDRVSALGYALGYLGGGLLFTINVLMTLHPEWFGLADAAMGVRLSFLLVAVWWAVFSLPLLRNVHEPPAAKAVDGESGAWLSALHELRHTLSKLQNERNIWMFLIGYWLYIDGVDTIVRMAVDYGLSLGFPSSALITALLITQFVGFPAAIAYGRLGEKLGTKRGILLGLVIYVGVTIYGYFMDSPTEFYVLAMVIGLVQGGVQALSRSFYSRLIPKENAAEFFGFYNMLGKFAAVIGPTLMGAVAVLTGSSRTAILSIAILLIAGGALLTRVRESH